MREKPKTGNEKTQNRTANLPYGKKRKRRNIEEDNLSFFSKYTSLLLLPDGWCIYDDLLNPILFVIYLFVALFHSLHCAMCVYAYITSRQQGGRLLFALHCCLLYILLLCVLMGGKSYLLLLHPCAIRTNEVIHNPLICCHASIFLHKVPAFSV